MRSLSLVNNYVLSIQPSQKKAEKKEKKKAEGGEKGGKGKKAEEEGPVDVSRLDFRVGRIVSAKKHPDADSLYVEEVRRCLTANTGSGCCLFYRFFHTYLMH